MDAYDAYWSVYKNGYCKELVEIIAKSSQYSYYYALNVIRAPFPLGEAAISSNGSHSYLYAHRVLRSRFPAGELAISKRGNNSLYYARDVLHGPFPLGEAAIARDSHDSLDYARDVLHGPFPAGEEAISRWSRCSYIYATKVLKGTFTAGEYEICGCTEYALDYHFRFNRNICSSKQLLKYPSYTLAHAIMIGGRFPEGEPSMKESPRIWKRYQEFLNGTA